MAPRRVKVSDPMISKRLEESGQAIVKKAAGMIVELDGTPMLTIKLATGAYKTKPGYHGQEFEFKDSYVGKSGDLVFVFAPVSFAEFELMELKVKAIDAAIPMFTPGVAEKFGHATESMPELVEWVGLNLGIEVAKAKAEEAQQAEVDYSTDPRFGMFA